MIDAVNALKKVVFGFVRGVIRKKFEPVEWPHNLSDVHHRGRTWATAHFDLLQSEKHDSDTPESTKLAFAGMTRGDREKTKNA